MALFVVLIVVVVLSVVISQLTVTTKIEEQIAKTRKGHIEVIYSFHAVARSAMTKLYDDWVADLEGASGGGATGAAPGTGTSGAGSTPGASPSGQAGQTSQGATDTRHEEWAELTQDSMNGVTMVSETLDGESCIALSQLFWYVTVEDDDQNPGTPGSPTGLPGSGTSSTGASPDPANPPNPAGSASPPDPADPIPDPPDYQMPSEERVDKTELMLARLIESVIDYNQEHGFDYAEIPTPETVAEAIANFVITRIEEESTRRIWTVESLLAVPEVDWELLNGPMDPDLAEDGDVPIDQDEFGEDDLSHALRSMGIDPSLFEQGSIAGYEDLEDGVEAVPRPLGLRHVICAYSTGQINLNTARPEVLAALLIDLEDYEEALAVAYDVNSHLDSYVVADEDMAGAPSQPEEDEEEPQEFNVLRTLDEVRDLKEEWTDTPSGADKSVWEYIQMDWQPVATFKSTYFTSRFTGIQGERELQAEMFLVRYGEAVRVLTWRELSK